MLQRIAIICTLSLFFLIGIYGYFHFDYYSAPGNRFSYSSYRGSPDYTMTYSHSEDGVDFYSIVISSRNAAQLFGYIYIPTNSSTFPGMILLAGAGGDKEKEADLALRIARLGYVVLTYDQRGVGQTTAPLFSFEEDEAAFRSSQEPSYHLLVYDVLKAFDVLRDLKYVNDDAIIVSGESQGGRTAIIAAAIEPRIKGVVAFASGGYSFNQETPYLQSIDPDTYVGSLAPRKLIMIHGKEDKVIPLTAALFTFSLAAEPKEFYTAQGCGHGVCEEMVDIFKSVTILD